MLLTYVGPVRSATVSNIHNIYNIQILSYVSLFIISYIVI